MNGRVVKKKTNDGFSFVFSSLFPTLVAPLATLKTSKTLWSQRSMRSLGGEATVEGARATRFSSSSSSSASSCPAVPMALLFLLLLLLPSPSPSLALSLVPLCSRSRRQGTHGTSLSAIQLAEAGATEGRRAKEGTRKSRCFFFFFGDRFLFFEARLLSTIDRSMLFLSFSLRSRSFSSFSSPPTTNPLPPPTGKSPRSTTAPQRAAPRRTSPRPSWSAKSRPTG